MIHVYIAERTAPDKQDQLNRLLTGELGQFMPTTTAPKLRPPPWSRLRQADVDRMAAARARQH